MKAFQRGLGSPAGQRGLIGFSGCVSKMKNLNSAETAQGTSLLEIEASYLYIKIQ